MTSTMIASAVAVLLVSASSVLGDELTQVKRLLCAVTADPETAMEKLGEVQTRLSSRGWTESTVRGAAYTVRYSLAPERKNDKYRSRRIVIRNTSGKFFDSRNELTGWLGEFGPVRDVLGETCAALDPYRGLEDSYNWKLCADADAIDLTYKGGDASRNAAFCREGTKG